MVGNFVMPVFSLGKPYPRKGFRPQACTYNTPYCTYVQVVFIVLCVI